MLAGTFFPGAAVSKKERPPQRCSILVVDDDPDVLTALREALETEGYRVRTAMDGIEALDSIAEERPALIISDLMMPTMTGFELLGALRSDPETASIPTLIITAARNSEKQLRETPILPKPLDLDALLRAIGALAPEGVEDVPAGDGRDDGQLN
jgi:CheY-like chemotaxis protein